MGSLDFQGLKKLGVVLKRAQYFLTCSGKLIEGLRVTNDTVLRSLLSEQGQAAFRQESYEQLSFFQQVELPGKEVVQCLGQRM